MSKGWGCATIITRGREHDPTTLPSLIAEVQGKCVGLLTYNVDESLEIVSLNSLQEGVSVGTALLNAVKTIAYENRCPKIWLVTTNDNKKAVEFYMRRGFRILAIHKDAIMEAREVKPEIPHTGIDGIQIRYEIEKELEHEP